MPASSTALNNDSSCRKPLIIRWQATLNVIEAAIRSRRVLISCRQNASRHRISCDRRNRSAAQRQCRGHHGCVSRLRLLTLRSADGMALTGSAASIAIPTSIALALWAGFDWLNNQPDAQFFPYGVPALAWYVLAPLLAAIVIALSSRPVISLARVCSLLAGARAGWIVIAQFAIEAFRARAVD